MIPIRDHNRSSTLPIMTYFLLGINTLIFVYSITLSAPELEQFIYQFSVIPREITQGQDLFTLLTSMFLHGSIGHLVGNMLFLNIFGDNLEDELGHFFYLLFYLVTGLGASFLQILANPNATIPNLGASGAIAGLMGGYLTLFPQHEIEVLFSFGYRLKTATVPAYSMVFYWVVSQLLGSFGQLAVPGAGGVAYLAHLGGFITGLAITKLVQPSIKRK